jgi:hypothetical protein
MTVIIVNIMLLLAKAFNPTLYEAQVAAGAQMETCVNITTHEVKPMSACGR